VDAEAVALARHDPANITVPDMGEPLGKGQPLGLDTRRVE
jgi:hypothetical protein